MHALDVPILFSALVFAVLAQVFWRQSPVAARVILGVATVFGYAAVAYPGMSIEDILGETTGGLTYMVAAARVMGFAAAMLAVATALRSWATR